MVSAKQDKMFSFPNTIPTSAAQCWLVLATWHGMETMFLITACTGTKLAIYYYYCWPQSTLNTRTLVNKLIFSKQHQ